MKMDIQRLKVLLSAFVVRRSCSGFDALDSKVYDGNYEVVIQMLKQKYDNRNFVIQSHIGSILVR